MQLRLGFSPCPNDTFIFDAIINKKIDMRGLDIEPVIADVEALNQMAFRGELEVTKLSYHALGHVLNRYAILDAGSALGRNCGPLLISTRILGMDELVGQAVAIPGKYTTAHLLLSLAFPEIQNKREMLFSDIEPALLRKEVGAGLIIHENRFTYQKKGLVKLMDLGQYWEKETGHPIPLGGIAIRRDLPQEVQQAFGALLRESVEKALADPEDTMDYVRPHAQEMEDEVMRAHIGLYVNDYSISLGVDGRAAVEELMQRGQAMGLFERKEGIDLFM